MRYTEFLNEAELFELKMSPNRLDSMVKNIPGALVGLEFELIVPGIKERDTDIGDNENGGDPDMSEDRRPTDIDDIVSFFCEEGEGGSYNTERL